MVRPLSLLVAVACTVAVADLGHKALADAQLYHERSALYAAGIGVACGAWAAAVVRLRSSSIAFAAGILVGGAAGNVLSVALWPGVPNPLVTGGLAFNVADVAVALGLVLLLPTTVSFGIRNRTRLFEPI